MAKFETRTIDEQIIDLPTIGTASGSVATFDTDLTENLVSVKCQIVAKQSGSGTPSPSNQRPIQTYDSLTLYHNDINMWDEEWEVGTFDNITGEKQPYANYWRSKNKIKVVPDTTYFCFSSNDVIYCYTYDINGNYIGFFRIGNNDSFTTGSTVYYINIVNVTRNDKTGYPVSINYPSTDTQYHAFNGAYIPFGQNVAGGVLDIGSGKLRVTHGIVRMADLVWVESEGIFTNRLSDGDLHTATRGSTNYCEIYKSSGATSSANMQDKSIQTMGGVGSANFWCKDTDYTTTSDFINSLGNYILVYPLATPIEIQLDSITLQALLNENNIWCDTGDTEVKYLLTVGRAS